MAQVITQIEMMRYQGAPLAVFPEGTILTPSAKDWAGSRGLKCASAAPMLTLARNFWIRSSVP